MIEKVILDYMNENLPVPVKMEIPAKDNVKKFVLLEKTGSSRTNRLNTATFAAQSYAESLYEAAQLNEQVKAVLDDAIQLDMISSTSLNSDYNFTDTETKRYRYQCIYVITYLEV